MDKEHYWNMLATISEMEAEETTHESVLHSEAQNIKSIAFSELIKCGESFQLESNKDEIEQIKAANGKNFFSAQQKEIPDLKEIVYIRRMDGTQYTIDASQLQMCMKKDYDKYVLKIEENTVQTFYDELSDIPDIYGDADGMFDDADDDENVEAELPEIEDADDTPKETGRSATYVPSLAGEMKYNRDPQKQKNLSTMCLNTVYMDCDLGNGQHGAVQFSIYPLIFTENAPVTDIVVVALSGEVVRAGISQGKSAAVQIDFDEMSFLVRGSWQDAEFKTQVNCLDKRFADKFVATTETYMPSSRTYTTYLQEELFGQTYSFFPVIVGQNHSSTGLAQCAMLSEEREGGRKHINILVSNDEDAFPLPDQNGDIYLASLYWKKDLKGSDSSLFLEVAPMD